MLTVDSAEFKELITHASLLRKRAAYEEALHLLESNLSRMANDCLTKAYLEIIDIAEKCGQFEKCLTYARKLEAIDPHSPDAGKFLK